jgi:glycosyltransferase involved in cell wall biosynthesis
VTVIAPLRVAFFPDADALTGNPYWSILKDGLIASGVQFVSPDRSLLHWLWETRSQPTVLHLHYVQHFYGYEGDTARLRWVLRLARNLGLARLLGHKVIFTLHDLVPTWPLEPHWVDQLGHIVAAHLANRVIVHCEGAANLLARHYGRRSKIAIVAHPSYIGVYPNVISRAEARSRLGLNADATVFGFVGGIRPNKGVLELIRVFRSLPGDNVRLLIAGKPWTPAEYVECVQTEALKDQRIHLEAVPILDDELQIYLRAADVVVLPGKRYLASGSVIMALSFGLPVIVPRFGCLEEIPPNVAIHFEPASVASLAEAMARAKESDLAAMGNCAYEYIRQFTPQRFVSQTLAVYRS